MLSWWWSVWLNNPHMLDFKAWVAGAGALLLFWLFLSDHVPFLRRGRRVRDVLLALLGLLSFACWFNLFRFHFDPFIHYYEFYHYYLGAKYTPELEYTRLYECTVIAEAEYAPYLTPQLARLRVRDLTTNELMNAPEILAHPERCKDHFTPERWNDFMRDSDFFRRASSWGFWSFALEDNGYNGTPVWSLFASPLANSGHIDDDLLLDLGYLDPALLTLMWLVCWWAFGWRTTCVALIFWGTNFAGRYFWNGGAFLRMDWLFCTIASICFMKKGRGATSGVLLTIGTLLRVFPGFVAVPLILKAAIASWRARKIVLSRIERRFAAGALVTLLVLVPLATWRAGSVHIWSGFVENSKKHLSTPLTNNMGLKAVLSWTPSSRAIVMKEPAALESLPSLEAVSAHQLRESSLHLRALRAGVSGADGGGGGAAGALGGDGARLRLHPRRCRAHLLLFFGAAGARFSVAQDSLERLGAGAGERAQPGDSQRHPDDDLARRAGAGADAEPPFSAHLRVGDDDAFVIISVVWLVLIAALAWELARPLELRRDGAETETPAKSSPLS